VAIAVDRIPLTEWQSNCYVIRASDEATEAVVLDPGGDIAVLTRALADLGLTTAGILVTHADIDHIGGVAELAAATGTEVWAPAGEAQLLRDGRTRTGRPIDAHDPEHPVAGGATFTLAGVDFTVVDIPGHSAGHVGYVADGQIFSGDLLFSGSVGRTDFVGGDWDTLIASIRALAKSYDRSLIVHPGHGGSTTLGHELDTNPFLGELRTA
jgi:glyoxylase-like metal-dependent hydrolase (beta-lactamase superfamily II)